MQTTVKITITTNIMRDMAIRNEHEAPQSHISARYILVARIFVVIVGCAAGWWGIVVFPVFWQGSSTERIANRIIAGAPFKAGTLAKQIPILENTEKAAYCRPAGLRSAAILRLRILEAATSANDRSNIDGSLKSLGDVIRSSLSCSPADPFLWAVLFWLENTRNGSDLTHLKYLRMSYQLGPNEGWITLKRNPIVLANFATLPPDLVEAGISEFVALVRSHLYNEAGDIVAGLTRPIRALLFTRLRDIKESDRQAFAGLLHERSLDDIPVPGTAPPLQHPWH
jgi:hypothetical protein